VAKVQLLHLLGHRTGLLQKVVEGVHHGRLLGREEQVALADAVGGGGGLLLLLGVEAGQAVGQVGVSKRKVGVEG
jgi:hypothetical protein